MQKLPQALCSGTFSILATPLTY